MTFAPTELLTVYLESHERLKVGRLARRQRSILFEYDPAFIASGTEISPLKLPLKRGVFTPTEAAFEGLFGVFNDSLPDGWGRLLLDRAIAEHGIGMEQLSVLDRLAHVGRGGMGALTYEPDHSPPVSGGDERLALDRLAKESATILEGGSEAVFEELLQMNGSSAGARPKIVAQVSADKSRIIHGNQPLRNGFAHWMIKFAASQDPGDIGAIEYAYSLMARAAGVEMPETHVFRAKKRQGYFGAKRFDRQGDQRIHMHSLSGLIHADHRTPSLDYNLILRVVLALTKDITEVEKAYRLACFNVLAYNRDDHAKNFSFLLDLRDPGRAWKFSPAYDLTFSNGPGGEQASLVMGEGRSPGIPQLRALGKEHNLKQAANILERVQSAVSRWKGFADEAGVTAKSTREIGRKIGS